MQECHQSTIRLGQASIQGLPPKSDYVTEQRLGSNPFNNKKILKPTIHILVIGQPKIQESNEILKIQ